MLVERPGEWQHLHKTRPGYEHGLGEWYIVDTHNAIIAHHVTLEGLVRELGVLRPYEELDV